MRLAFKQWFEAGNIIDLPQNAPPGDLDDVFPNPYQDPSNKKRRRPGIQSKGKTNAMGDFHGPGSDELPPNPSNNYKMKKR